MDNLVDVFCEVVSKLETANIEYMVVGSIASSLYGEARMTNDLDIVINIEPVQAETLEQLFPLTEFYCPPIEVLKSEIVQRGQFNLLHHKSGLKIDLMIQKSTPHAKMEIARRQKLELWPGRFAYIASPEDVILKKLDFYRQGESEKHLTDIRGILAETVIDKNYLQQWVAKLSLEKQWQSVAE